ncbi:LON peptidase substrate-binding domain-containing protein [Roseomonas sp. HJA6]|uniref:LON peptidase substrate-binding domain-containing protein n=1 Tax=Roseomonas alba TaxID=2846776 RepID=A0ABS7ADD1_9PROT|nr:LON peptidase substrate-binding domain-containing protein [Neoroseomonas alba]MBW6400308.1 LON peptidase substrate-binding domain-containing protein [Neoroseomonas alba]
MPAFHPRFAELPEEIAVFPLSGALLLPQGRLPLNVFEPRYLAMTLDSLARGRMFGMVQPDARLPAGATGPGLYAIGCLGRLTSFSETEDGRLLITLTGLIRFRIAEELPLAPGGYRRVRADYGSYAGDLATDPGPTACDRAALLAALRPYFRARGIEANWEAVEQTADAMLVTTLSMVCPFEASEKQALLEAADTTERARTLVTLLRMGGAANAPCEGRPS